MVLMHSYPLIYPLFYNGLFMWESYSMLKLIIYILYRTAAVSTVSIVTVLVTLYVPMTIVC